ncbi:MAG TPA: cytochrome-c oxidase, cbb3-type subunit III [Burkholderiaceae bacterium]|nr:cytochrome-c oxidase, cbb3-type subunit III [Burkholderiaceae bacterium]
MSDFVNSGWSIFVAALTIGGLLGCLWLLFVASRRQPMAADNSTGHVFDEDLVEMNNPLPRWWMWLFILTVVFAFAYVAMFPGLGSFAGRLNWSSANQLEADKQAAALQTAPIYAAFKSLPAAELSHNPKAMAIGERLFSNNCAACHGSDARGSKGFPNLTDNDWLHGGTPEKIEETITQGRVGMMPPMAAAVGTPEDVRNVANYVLSLSGSPHNAIAAAAGRAKFTVCAACHGADGKGNQALGAPNLTDKIWLHGWGEDAIVAMVTQGKTNTMPAQHGRLTPDQIHVLATYVWSLSQSALPVAVNK